MSQKESQTAWVAGATGMVGNHLIRELLSAPSYGSVVALVRRPLEYSHPKLHAVVVDYNKLAEAPLPHPDVIFSALGTTIKKAGSKDAFRKVDFEYPLRLAKLGRTAGATKFLLVSSVDANPKSGNFYLRVKGELEDAISTLGYSSFRIFRPSFLVGERQESRMGENLGVMMAQGFAFALNGPWRKYRAISAEVVARAMIVAAGKAPGKRVYEYRDMRALEQMA